MILPIFPGLFNSSQILMKYEQGRRGPQIVIAVSVTDSDDKKIEIGFKFYPLGIKIIICHFVISDS